MTLCYGSTFNAETGGKHCENKPDDLPQSYWDSCTGRKQGVFRECEDYYRAQHAITVLAAQPFINCLGSPPPTPPSPPSPPSPLSLPPVPYCSGRAPQDSQTCQALAEYLGLRLGDEQSSFTFQESQEQGGLVYEVGCYAYKSGSTGSRILEGMAFFGTGGTQAQMESAYFGSDSDKYRLMCPPSSDPNPEPSSPPPPPFCGFTIVASADGIGGYGNGYLNKECKNIGGYPAKISNSYENAMLLQEFQKKSEEEGLSEPFAGGVWLGIAEFQDTLQGSHYWVADGAVLDDPKVFRFWDRYPYSCEDASAWRRDFYREMCNGHRQSDRYELIAPSRRCDDLPDHRCPTHPTCTCKEEAQLPSNPDYNLQWRDHVNQEHLNPDVYKCARACVANTTRRTPVTHGPRITTFSNWFAPNVDIPNVDNERWFQTPGTSAWVVMKKDGCTRLSKERPRRAQ